MPLFDAHAPAARHTGNETGHQPIAAAVTPWTVYSQTERRWALTDEEWQTKVRKYDREGPGIVGAALDMPAATSMLIDLVIRRRHPSGKGYEVVKDEPLLTAALGLWSGEMIDQRLLFSRLLRTLDAVGECYLISHNATPGRGRMFWQLAQTTNVTDNKDGTATVRTRPDARFGDQGYKIVPDRYVYRAMTSDIEWEGVPWAPMRRGLPHIEQYRAAMRNIGRNLDSQLAMNGVLWAKSVGQAVQWPDHLRSWAHRAITSDDGIESVMPFAMTTPEKPEFIDVGRGDHKDQIEVANMFLQAFAQSTDLPTNMLLEGPAQGNHWNAFLEGDFYADMTMQPRWARAVQVVTRTHLRPLLRALPRSLTAHLGNVLDYEVWCEDGRIRSRTDNSTKVVEAWDRGIATDEALAEAAGLREDQIRDLPPGIESYENYLVYRQPSRLTSKAHPGETILFDRLEPWVRDRDPGRPEQPDTARRRPVPGTTVMPNNTPLAAEVTEATAEIVETVRRERLPEYWHELVPVP